MQKNIFNIFLITLLQFNATAQPKPQLPSNFFDDFKYTLPKEFNYNDSVQLSGEINKIATELFKLHNNASNNYTIKDSTELYYFLESEAALLTYFGKNQKAIDNVLKARTLRPTPNYIAPFGLAIIAFNNTCLLQKDDGSEAFGKIYSSKLKEQYNLINPDYRNDILNQSKGVFTQAAIPIAWKNISNTFEQAINKSKGVFNFGGANQLFSLYRNYLRLKNYQSYIEAALYSVSPSKVVEEKIKIPMRDGIKLNAYIYNDIVNANKLPAIISLSPYPSGNEARVGNVYATNGYIYVYVDCRGRRESEGTFMPYENDAQDYYDIIDWVSKQPWCNGQVATTGGSYLGFAQWQAIKKQYKHPALKAINPMVSVGFGVDFPRQANIFDNYTLQWATLVSGKENNTQLFRDWKFWNDKNYELYKNRLPFNKLDSVVGMPNPIWQKWISHPSYDDYWLNIMPNQEDYKSIDIPIFSITGYYDADQLGAMHYYNEHQKHGNTMAKNNHYLLIGPYDHGGAQWQPGNIQYGNAIEKEAQIPIYKYVIWWFDWVLKGKQKPAFIKDQITYFETGNNIWKGTPSLKQLTTDSIELFLSPTPIANKHGKDLLGLSINKNIKSSKVKYTHDISSVLDSTTALLYYNSPIDTVYLKVKQTLVFESLPVKNDVVLSNKIISRIYATINVPDADFSIYIQEVDEKGVDKNIAIGNIRVKYRNDNEKPMLVKPNEVLQLNFNDVFIYIKKIKKGSKLRLVFESLNNPWNQKNYGFGGDVSAESTKEPRIIEASILTGGKYASKIILPLSKN